MCSRMSVAHDSRIFWCLRAQRHPAATDSLGDDTAEGVCLGCAGLSVMPGPDATHGLIFGAGSLHLYLLRVGALRGFAGSRGATVWARLAAVAAASSWRVAASGKRTVTDAEGRNRPHAAPIFHLEHHPESPANVWREMRSLFTTWSGPTPYSCAACQPSAAGRWPPRWATAPRASLRPGREPPVAPDGRAVPPAGGGVGPAACWDWPSRAGLSSGTGR